MLWKTFLVFHVSMVSQHISIQFHRTLLSFYEFFWRYYIQVKKWKSKDPIVQLCISSSFLSSSKQLKYRDRYRNSKNLHNGSKTRSILTKYIKNWTIFINSPICFHFHQNCSIFEPFLNTFITPKQRKTSHGDWLVGLLVRSPWSNKKVSGRAGHSGPAM